MLRKTLVALAAVLALGSATVSTTAFARVVEVVVAVVVDTAEEAVASAATVAALAAATLAAVKGADLSASGIVTVRIGYGPTARPITTPMQTATSATSGLVATPGILAATLRVGPIWLWPAPLEKIKAGGDCPPALIRTIRGRCVQAIV